MYSDSVKRRWWIIAVIAAVVIALIAAVRFSSVQSRELMEESAEEIKAAVQRSAMQCYIVEGVYPPNLAYLEENYALQVNENDYYITYSAFASNLPPDVNVTPKYNN